MIRVQISLMRLGIPELLEVRVSADLNSDWPLRSRAIGGG
jgi:hypothetical protein